MSMRRIFKAIGIGGIPATAVSAIFSVAVDVVAKESSNECNTNHFWNVAFFCNVAAWASWGTLAGYLYLTRSNEVSVSQQIEDRSSLRDQRMDDSDPSANFSDLEEANMSDRSRGLTM